MSWSFMDRVNEVATGSVATYIYSKERGELEDIRIKAISAQNKSHSCATAISLGLRRGGWIIPLYRMAGAIAVGVPAIVFPDVLIPADVQIYAYFENATAADELELDIVSEYE